MRKLIHSRAIDLLARNAFRARPSKENVHCRRQCTGFTLTELMFAMAFLAFLLLFIVNAMVQFMATYNTGLTYKAINQTGRIVFEDITRSVRVSGADTTHVDRGRLCVGGQAYVWNINRPSSDTNNQYESGGAVEGVIRVPDTTGGLCKDDSEEGDGENESNNPNVIGDGVPVTVIAPERVAVQEFNLQSADSGGLYHLQLTLSTSGDNAPERQNGRAVCPGGRDGQFCAVANFETNIAIRR